MTEPTPEITALSEPYWDSLAAGVLVFQRCRSCGHAWLPPREACPSCLAADYLWQPASGRGRVLSWVVYHKAYAEHLESRLPYDVTLVELEEGPRLLSNVVDSDAGKALTVNQAVVLEVVERSGASLACFRLAEGRPES